MRQTLQFAAHGLKFNDKLRRTASTPSVNHFRPTKGQQTPKETQPASKGASGSGKGPAEGSTSKTRLYCKICRSKGHHAKQCPNRQADLENRVNFLTKQLSELTKGGSRTGSEAAWPHSPSPPGSSRPQAVIKINVLSHSKEFPKAPAWMVDGGASVHLVGDPELLHNPVFFNTPKTLHLATSDVKGKIIAEGSLCLKNKQGQLLWLHNVQCSPAATTPLLSVSQLVKDGCIFLTNWAGVHNKLWGPQMWQCPILQKNCLYYLEWAVPVPRPKPPDPSVNLTKLPDPVTRITGSHHCGDGTLWHTRLGHPGNTAMSRLDRENLVSGIPVPLQPCPKCPKQCEPCIQGKSTRLPFGPATNPAVQRLQRIHLDTVGELPVPALGGGKVQGYPPR